MPTITPEISPRKTPVRTIKTRRHTLHETMHNQQEVSQDHRKASYHPPSYGSWVQLMSDDPSSEENVEELRMLVNPEEELGPSQCHSSSTTNEHCFDFDFFFYWVKETAPQAAEVILSEDEHRLLLESFHC